VHRTHCPNTSALKHLFDLAVNVHWHYGF